MGKLSSRFADLGRDGAPAKLGLMGGTFDPIHIGHLRIAEEVREELGLDGVLFIPTGNPVFKRDQHVTDAQVRLRWCREAVAGNPHFDVSSIEVDRAGDTFTIDTLRELRGQYPESVEFYFIVGADAAETIGKWRGVVELAELTHLVVAAGRPGFAQADELHESILAAAPFDLRIVQVSQLEISSSDIRARLAAGKSVRYLVPEPIRKKVVGGYSPCCSNGGSGHGSAVGSATPGFPCNPDAGSGCRDAADPASPCDSDGASGYGGSPVGAHSVRPPAKPARSSQDDARARMRPDGRGHTECAPTGLPSHSASSPGPCIQDPASADALSKAFFNARKDELAQRVSPKRFKHSLGVSDTCAKLAKEYGVDVKKARLAGLLHDWDKGMDDQEARARVYELGMEDEIDPYVVEEMPGVLHGITAARALGREFPAIPADVLQAISRHTTAALDMSLLDMVLYVADAIEPSRQFGRIDELRAAVGTCTLEELYFQTYEYWVFLLFERRRPLHPDTIALWNAYTARLPRKAKAGNGDGSLSRKKQKRK